MGFLELLFNVFYSGNLYCMGETSVQNRFLVHYVILDSRVTCAGLHVGARSLCYSGSSVVCMVCMLVVPEMCAGK